MQSLSLRRSLFTRPVLRQFLGTRTLQQSSRLQARKDAQDKDSLKPESNEYSKSGSDGEAAATDNAAFSPDKTRPEEEHDKAGKEAGADGENNPLNVSPANPEVSKPRDPQEGGPEGSAAETDSKQSGRERTSGGASPKKGGQGQ